MKIKQPLCYCFLGFWTLCGAAMMLPFVLLAGGSSFWPRTFLTLIGALLGFGSALIAWRRNKELQWRSISYVMVVSALLLPMLFIILPHSIYLISCDYGSINVLDFFLYDCYFYCQILCFSWPFTVSSAILIFVFNYFLTKKLKHDEEEEKEFEEVWKKIAD